MAWKRAELQRQGLFFADPFAAYAPLCLGFLPIIGTYGLSIAERMAVVRGAAKRAGRDPRAVTCGSLALLLCHPDRDRIERWLDHPFMQWHALTGFPFGRDWRAFGHVHRKRGS